MNASMAMRIRCAESLLIYAIDRQHGGQRDWSQSAQPQTHAVQFPVVDRNGDRTGGNPKPNTTSESCAALKEHDSGEYGNGGIQPALIPAAVQLAGGNRSLFSQDGPAESDSGR
jgi:hypothetical protein